MKLTINNFDVKKNKQFQFAVALDNKVENVNENEYTLFAERISGKTDRETSIRHKVNEFGQYGG